MLTIVRYLDIPLPDHALLPADPEKVLFFDIETTGFSPASSSLYLIGTMVQEGGRMKLTQWFASRMSQEEELLEAFAQCLPRYACLVHFNGDQFDIPYLEKCARAYRISLPFSSLTSLDLLKKAREQRELLQLDSCRQTALERFLGIHRKDRFDGGQLIAVYQQYLRTQDESLLDSLLLHNAEDVSGMLRLLPILSYEKAALSLDSASLVGWEKSADTLTLVFRSEFSVPIAVTRQKVGCLLALEHSRMTIQTPLFCGELKYFYPNYQDYYYLPEEDIAVHQKVASFVEKSHRRRATRATAYLRKSGTFLKIPSSSFGNSAIFRTDWRSKDAFIEFDPKEGALSAAGIHIAEVLLQRS